MLVFKFGGASVKDAESIQNVLSILTTYQETKKVVVISAMGKTTNALEEVVQAYYQKDEKYIEYLRGIREYHQFVADDLFGANSPVQYKIDALFDQVESFCHFNTSQHFGFIYDQIVPVGELASTKIISEYLNRQKINNQWLDARDVIRTDHAYTDACVDWQTTEALITKKIASIDADTYITQGFIASTAERFSTTLGREGSDFSAAIFSYCLGADKMVVWKDVPGILNADPREFKETKKLDAITYREAIEMTYYGAKVIHPKTIRPLQNKQIPLEVRSFIQPTHQGTTIAAHKMHIDYPPIYVRKHDQVLFSFAEKDFSFISENSLSRIIKEFDNQRLRINLMHNGAISFSIISDNKPEKIKAIQSTLAEQYDISISSSLELLTIRHYDSIDVSSIIENHPILLEEKTEKTIQFLWQKNA